jgi:hypothetical protein
VNTIARTALPCFNSSPVTMRPTAPTRPAAKPDATGTERQKVDLSFHLRSSTDALILLQKHTLNPPMSAIVTSDVLARFVVTTLTFEDLACREEDVFHGGEGYAGVIRAKAEIEIVRILARIETLNVAEDSFFYIDDLSFGRELKGGY